MGQILLNSLYWVYLALGLLIGVIVTYLLILTMLAPLALYRLKREVLTHVAPKHKFAFLVPAYNEEFLIERAVTNLLAQDYPTELFAVHVVADNCTDNTAARARQAGAIVHERKEPDLRGKGYALHWLQRRLFTAPEHYDGYAIIDADCIASPNFLREMDRLFGEGAQVIQAYNTVLNTTDSWGSSLRYVALILLHYLRPLGRSIFGGSAGLKGTGMCLAHDVLSQENWDAFSVTEDIQFHVNLLLRGLSSRYAARAMVMSEMPVTLSQAYSQNVRWESGRLQIARAFVPRLLWAAIRRRSVVLFDAAMEQLIPPFSVLFGLTTIYLLGGLGIALFSSHYGSFWLGLFLITGQMVYTLGGLVLAKTPAKIYLGLLYAPVYICWKVLMYLKLASGKNKPTEWVRTERLVESPGSPPKPPLDLEVPTSQ